MAMAFCILLIVSPFLTSLLLFPNALWCSLTFLKYLLIYSILSYRVKSFKAFSRSRNVSSQFYPGTQLDMMSSTFNWINFTMKFEITITLWLTILLLGFLEFVKSHFQGLTFSYYHIFVNMFFERKMNDGNKNDK